MAQLWTAEFASTVGIFGAGVVVFNDGELLGGDAGYTYVGSYTRSGENFVATLLVEPFLPNFLSVFNTVDQKFTLKVEGVLGADEGIGHGVATEMPGVRFSVKLRKKQ
jgi:hypothetical protein